MRRVDKWIGVPACFLLTCVRRSRELVARGPGHGRDRQRILFVKLAEQGSTVLAQPAIRRAIEMVGRANVFFLVFESRQFHP